MTHFSPFSVSGTYQTGGSFTNSIKLGDFNKDGFVDAAVVNGGSNSISILFGQGDGTFGSVATYSVGGSPSDLAVGDLNNDGNADIVVSNSQSNSVSVLSGNADGTFTTVGQYGVGSYPAEIRIADMNSDGKADIIVSSQNSGGINVLYNVGSTQFANQRFYSVGTSSTGVTIGDLDRDGRNDIIAADYGRNGIAIFFGNGSQSFISGIGAAPVSVDSGDMNGDGLLDVAIANRNGSSVTVLYGNGSGSFFGSTNVPTGMSYKVAVTDLNFDGRADLITTTVSGHVDVRLSSGTNFIPVGRYAPGGSPYDIAVGDLNGDFHLDIVSANLNSSIAVMLQDNNRPPTISGPTTADVQENAAANTVVATLSATDPDGNPVSYSFVSGNESGAFKIVGNEIQVADPSKLDFETASLASYTLQVKGSDGTLGSTNTLSIAITVTDVNEGPTAVTLENPVGKTAENGAALKVANITVADDALGVNALHVSDETNFEIRDGASGKELWFKTGADFEGTNSYSVTVTATDTESKGSATSSTFTLRINNLNDVAPVFSSGSTGLVDENAPITTVIHKAVAADAEADFGEVSYSLSGTDVALLNIDAATGAVTLKNPANYEAKASYSFDVVASQGTGPSATQAVIVSVNNQKEGPSAAATSKVTIDEDVASSAVEINATDQDGDALTYSLKSGAEAAKGTVSFDQTAGTFTYTPNANVNGSDTFTILISDGTATVEQVVSVTINPINDAAKVTVTNPDVVIEGNTGTFAGQIVTIAEHVSITDMDQNDAPTLYVPGSLNANSISVSGPQPDGGAARLFTVAPALGTISYGSDSFDYLQPGQTVDVSFGFDVQSGSEVIHQVIHITISGENDAPMVKTAIASVSTKEKQTFSLETATHFSDVDAGDVLAYSVSGPSWLMIDAATGTLTGTPVDADVGVQSVTVTATDKTGEKASSTFNLTVENVNAAPEIDQGIAAQTATEDQAFDFAIPADAFKDIDGDSLTLAVTSKPAWLTYANGRLTGTPSDAEVGRDHTVTVEATDPDGEKVSTNFKVTVTNVNDAPVVPETLTGTGVKEDAAAAVVGTLNGTDVDSSNLTYGFSNAVGGTFTRNGTTGEVTFTAAENFNGTASATYTVSDGSLSDTGTLSVKVEAVNDAPVATADAFGAGTTKVYEGAEFIIDITDDLLANDVDVDGDTFQFDGIGTSPKNGTLQTITEGGRTYLGYTYTSTALAENATADDAFTYKLKDAFGAVSTGAVSLKVTGLANKMITGTNQIDTLNGSNTAHDTIDGLNADDVVNGHGGNDKLFGNNGNDRLFGGEGADVMDGGRGDDLVDGGKGNDVMTGGLGADTFDFSLLNGSVVNTGADRINDFKLGVDDIRLGAGITILSIDATKDLDRDGQADTTLILSNGGSIEVLGINNLTKADWALIA